MARFLLSPGLARFLLEPRRFRATERLRWSRNPLSHIHLRYHFQGVLGTLRARAAQLVCHANCQAVIP